MRENCIGLTAFKLGMLGLFLSMVLAKAFAQNNTISPPPHLESIYVWQGFSHHWGYNHRVNRLGSWVETPALGWSGPISPPQERNSISRGRNHSPVAEKEIRPAVVHAAASGSGSDEAQFNIYYREVRAEGISSFAGKETLHFSGEEFQQFHLEKEVEFTIPRRPIRNVEVLLNGFDLRPVDSAKADKFIQFSISIEEVRIAEVDYPEPDTAPRKVVFTVAADLKMACSSPECEFFNPELNYLLDVYWVALLGDFKLTQGQDSDFQIWDKYALDSPLVVGQQHRTETNYPDEVIGIKGFSLDLHDQEHHFSDLVFKVWKARHFPPFYKVKSELYFGQWNPGMYQAFREYYTGRIPFPARWVTLKDEGSCELSLDYAILKFARETGKCHSQEGTIQWFTQPGEQARPGGPAAMKRVFLE